MARFVGTYYSGNSGEPKVNLDLVTLLRPGRDGSGELHYDCENAEGETIARIGRDSVDDSILPVIIPDSTGAILHLFIVDDDGMVALLPYPVLAWRMDAGYDAKRQFAEPVIFQNLSDDYYVIEFKTGLFVDNEDCKFTNLQEALTAFHADQSALRKKS